MEDERFKAPKINRPKPPEDHDHMWSTWDTAFEPKEQYRYCLIKGCPEVETRIQKA